MKRLPIGEPVSKCRRIWFGVLGFLGFLSTLFSYLIMIGIAMFFLPQVVRGRWFIWLWVGLAGMLCGYAMILATYAMVVSVVGRKVAFLWLRK